MKHGHSFSSKHGFTGSANPSEDFRPTIPGYKRGGKVHEDEAEDKILIKKMMGVKKMAKGGACMKRGGKVKSK